MPIYGYLCGACGYQKDVLQKLSDAPLTVCPDCGADKFGKQVSAPSFRLSGSGWYETDFKTGQKKNLAGDQANSSKQESPSGQSSSEQSKTADKTQQANNTNTKKETTSSASSST